MTTTFGRAFKTDSLTDAVEENSWLRDLLSHWYPSGAIGKPVGGKDVHLRLAIRDGYLNFYRAGQSVAKVGYDRRGKVQAKIHNKYVHGEEGSGQGYVTLTSAGFADSEGRLVPYESSHLHGWIKNATRKTGDEKKFLDLIIGRNPNVVDVEMALPAYSNERIAPRMDLVATEPVGDRWQIVFWEAKLVGDARARCEGDKPPKVVSQVKNYTAWLEYGTHREMVTQAYQRTCRLLVELHAVARRYRPDIEELGFGIRMVAVNGAPPLLVDVEPRLLIDDPRSNVGFTKNGHLEKLRTRHKLHVQMVRDLDHLTLEVLA